tara:strand:+ start:1040 stop:1504 length:465 start_codon:yes stop_codon:yes gene_type:complete
MASGEYDILAEQGTTFKLSLTYKDSSDSAVDLALQTGNMQVRRSVSDNQALLFLSGPSGSHVAPGIRGSLTGGGSTGEFTTGTTQGQTGTGGIMLNASSTGGTGTTGGIYIQIDSSTMANVPAGNHVYDLELVSGSSVTRILQGRFEVTAEVTR